MASGLVSAARTMISAIPRLSVFVHSLAPFLTLVSDCEVVRRVSIYLFQLASVRCLLEKIEEALGELLVCQWVGRAGVVRHLYA
jgi:hypothetical protein